MKAFVYIFSFSLFLISISASAQFVKLNSVQAQQALDAMQLKGKDVFRPMPEKDLKLENGDVITTAVCFCDSMPGGFPAPFNNFKRTYGLTTKSGKKWNPVYDNITYWEKDRYLVKYHDFGPVGKYEEVNLYAMIDQNLKVLQVYMEDGISETYYTVKKGGKYGTITGAMDVVLPFVYDSLSSLSMLPEVPILVKERSFYSYAARGNGKWGLITTDNDTIIPFKYQYLGNSDRGWMVAKDKNKWGVIGLGDTLVLPFVFDSIYAGYYLKGKKWGLLPDDLDHKKANFEYDEIVSNPGMGASLGRIGTKWYFVKSAKVQPTDESFDGYYLDPDSGPFTCLKKGDKYCVYNRYKGDVTGYKYSKVVDVLYERGQEYDYYGYYTDFPIYRFKMIEDGKEVEFTLRDR